ncbi:hypothetical protein [Usitatibacter rugosus]|uniref:hypothetical protein n=1 Tax=Usitatibacter rugosus TaxID=2732067 RepID=UPI001489E6CD|nr:hypothetical protein [Usitatibacter rugosus]
MIANPVAHWFSKFQCPHCAKALRFDARTNGLGVAGSACFVGAGVTYMLVAGPTAPTIIAALLAAWIVLSGLSYALRGIEKA